MRTRSLLPLLLFTILARADVLPPAQDTSSLKGKLTAITGKATTLPVSATRKGFVLFNLGSLPADVQPADIVNARLRVYFPSAKRPGDIAIHTVTAAWDETSAATEPGISASPVAMFPVETVVAKKFVEVDVTATVQAWRVGTMANSGFAFVASGITNVRLGAKEGSGSGYPCELDVEIERAIPDGTIGTTQIADGAVTNMKLVTPSLTVTAGTGLSGGGTVALGGNVTVSIGSNLALGGTTTGTFSGDGSELTNLNVSIAVADASIANAKLANAALTVTAGTGLTGGGTVALGGTTTVSLGSDLTLGGTTTGTFIGTMLLLSGTENLAPLRLQAGTNLITPVFGAVEFDGTNLFLTNNNASPTRKTIAFTDSTVTSAQIAPGAVGNSQLALDLTLGGTTAGTFSGPLTGNVTGNVSGSAASFTGSLTGDVTGTQGATAISDGTVTSKLLTGFASGAGTVAASDSILSAIGKLDGNDALKAPLASPTFTGTVLLPTGSATAPSLRLQSGVNLATPSFGAIEFDGTNLFVTNNSASPTRKTLAFTDSTITAAQIATGTVTSSHLVSDLALGGTTTGSFSGSLTGNVTGNVSGSAASFTGSLAGDVTGTQAETVVSTVGGVTAVNVAAGVSLANAATSANTANTLVRRDPSGNFSAGAITIAGNLNLPATTSNTAGVITQNGNRLIHSFGTGNFFAGNNAGNFLVTGSANTAVGTFALSSNTTGFSNTAIGSNTLATNTAGTNNTAIGTSALRFNTGDSNTATGSAALRANTTGTFNTANGTSALIANTTGSSNTAVGGNALSAATTGSFNTAAGASTLENNTTAGRNVAIGYRALTTQSFSDLDTPWNSNNVAVGYEALRDNQPTSTTNGNANTAIGTGALQANTTGSRNTAAGYQALSSNTTAIENTATGYQALQANTTGTFNTASGYQALQFNTTAGSNTAVGWSALLQNTTGGNNTANGRSALQNNTTAGNNVAIGRDALLTQSFSNSNTAWISNNVAVGWQALRTNAPTAITNGINNTALGTSALQANTTGNVNTACGGSALFSNTTGGANTACGYNSLTQNTTGSSNTAIGLQALFLNTTGSNNTVLGSNAMTSQSFNAGGPTNNVAVGFQALRLNQPTATTNGINNTAVGTNALAANTTGANNIAVGNNAGNLLTTGNNNIDIGHVGVAAESGVIRIGTQGTQSTAFVAGIRGAATGVNDAVPVVIDSNGQLGTASSSQRYKENIADMGDASARLEALRPVTFRYRQAYADGRKPVQFGLIAEEVAKVFPELAVFNAEGQPETVKYQDLTPLLLNEFLKDHHRAEAMEKAIAELKHKDAEIAELKQRLDRIEALLGK